MSISPYKQKEIRYYPDYFSCTDRSEYFDQLDRLAQDEGSYLECTEKGLRYTNWFQYAFNVICGYLGFEDNTTASRVSLEAAKFLYYGFSAEIIDNTEHLGKVSALARKLVKVKNFDPSLKKTITKIQELWSKEGVERTKTLVDIQNDLMNYGREHQLELHPSCWTIASGEVWRWDYRFRFPDEFGDTYLNHAQFINSNYLDQVFSIHCISDRFSRMIAKKLNHEEDELALEALANKVRTSPIKSGVANLVFEGLKRKEEKWFKSIRGITDTISRRYKVLDLLRSENKDMAIALFKFFIANKNLPKAKEIWVRYCLDEKNEDLAKLFAKEGETLEKQGDQSQNIADKLGRYDLALASYQNASRASKKNDHYSTQYGKLRVKAASICREKENLKKAAEYLKIPEDLKTGVVAKLQLLEYAYFRLALAEGMIQKCLEEDVVSVDNDSEKIHKEAVLDSGKEGIDNLSKVVKALEKLFAIEKSGLFFPGNYKPDSEKALLIAKAYFLRAELKDYFSINDAIDDYQKAVEYSPHNPIYLTRLYEVMKSLQMSGYESYRDQGILAGKKYHEDFVLRYLHWYDERWNKAKASADEFKDIHNWK